MAGEMGMITVILYLVLGVFSGIFSATFGVGSGIIIIPAVTFFAMLPQKDAQGISLAVMVPMALMGALRYYWNPDIHIDLRIVAILAVAVIIGANIGAEIVSRVSNRTLQLGFGCVLFMVAFRFVYQAVKGT